MKIKSIVLSAFLITSSLVSSAQANLIINEVFIGSQDYIELVNTGNSDIDLLGFSIDFYESNTDLFTFTNSFTLSAGQLLVLGEQTTDQFYTGFNIPFNQGTAFSISLLNASGSILDYVASINNLNLPVSASFVGGPLANIPNEETFSFHRIADTHSANTFYTSDWAVAAPSKGQSPLVVSTQVPEPATLAILGLGLLGLRLGKKSK